MLTIQWSMQIFAQISKTLISGQKLQVMSELKYLGVWIDTKLSFGIIYKRVGFNLISNFTFFRNSTTKTAMLSVNAIIIPHFTYCLMNWAQANKSTLGQKTNKDFRAAKLDKMLFSHIFLKKVLQLMSLC